MTLPQLLSIEKNVKSHFSIGFERPYICIRHEATYFFNTKKFVLGTFGQLLGHLVHCALRWWAAQHQFTGVGPPATSVKPPAIGVGRPTTGGRPPATAVVSSLPPVNRCIPALRIPTV